MVFQNRHHLAEVRVCNLSLQRHETSTVAFRQQQKQLLGRRLKTRVNFNIGGKGFIGRMQSQQQEQQQQHEQQPLPLVELSPFRKSVWRREKSLPDFYERRQGLNSQPKQQQQQKDEDGRKQTVPNPLPRSLSNGKDKQNQQIDLTPNEMLARLSAAVHAPDGEVSFHSDENIAHNQHQNSSKSRCCTHPKAEFHHESTRLWRTQDFIPGFITRLERTKTSMLSFYRDNSSVAGDVGFYLGEESGGGFVNYSGGSSESSGNVGGMRVKGGRMKQQVHRRPLLYLNPLDSYRQVHDISRDTVHPWSEYPHLHSHSKLATRNSCPLTPGRAREFMLSGAGHATYPLRPVRHHGVKSQEQDSTDVGCRSTACHSPHKFNSKLGAAKNSLEVLSSLGAPTKLEKSLVAEYQMNLERFRRDRLMVNPLDLRSVPSQYVSASMNLTRGELSLQEAREANRARRRKNVLTPIGGTSSSSSSQLLNTDRGSLVSQSGEDGGFTALPLQTQQYSFVDPALHPLGSVLAEETESHVLTDDDQGSASAVNTLVVKSTIKSAPSKMVKADEGELNRGEEHIIFNSTSSCVGKIQNIDSHDELCKDSVVSTESTKKLLTLSDKEVNITLDDNGEAPCLHDPTTPVSAGGSSTSRAKTNLEYLNKLRTRSGPRPIHPLTHTPIENDTNTNLSLQGTIDDNVGSYRVGDSIRCTDFEKKKKDQAVQENCPSKEVQTNVCTEQEVSSAEKQDRAVIEEHVSPLGPGANVSETNLTVTKEIVAETDIQPVSRENQNDQVEVSLINGVSPTDENDAASEDEGVASPKETASSNAQADSREDIISTERQGGSAQATARSEQLSLPGCDREISGSGAPCLTARRDTREGVCSTTPYGTPLTRVDSATVAGTPLTNLDTSLEPFSETEGGQSTSADNGDSGVSTTFLTAEDSSNILDGAVFN
ncbi:hypothetical protein EGW08_000254 [Elysia chlorotica]|uniref:Uncharacterized protein n=1 Tax=Elysia chlorotica TaxID=188477 RepID=A0A3S1A1L5_ELYCH|nr:hypothetical protein EGW08_000254 [Elysia chlorotica]